MTTSEAKRIIQGALASHGLTNRVTAKTVSFSDLARGTCVFVQVHEWDPSPLAANIEQAAIQYGFYVQFKQREH